MVATTIAPAITNSAIRSGAWWMGSPSSNVGKSVDGSITGIEVRDLTDVDMEPPRVHASTRIGRWRRAKDPPVLGTTPYESRPGPRGSALGRRRADRAAQEVDELIDPELAPLRRV